ncbi:MAG: S41 family peptidase [Patescibacteria group bacterium]
MPESNRGKKKYLKIGIAVIILAIVFFIGYRLGLQKKNNKIEQNDTASSDQIIRGLNSAAPKDVNLPADFKEFWDLWREIKTRYYKQPVDDKTLFYGAMQGLAASMGDPYTVFFEPKTANEFSQSLQGKFEGIGAEIGIKDEQLQIIAPLPDTPADKAGLRSGDAILTIDKTETVNMSVDRAVMLIRGNKGTPVVLGIGRITTEKDENGKERKKVDTFDVTILRDVITVKSVIVKYRDNGIALIEINHFNQDTIELFNAAVEEILTKDVKGIVLDLRNDPGGYLDRATYVASEWVGDKVIVIEKRQDKITDQYHGTGKARLKSIPTVVLVNEGSASASEIVAGALQDYGVAKVVGKKTFGKGSVQDYNEFPDNSAYKMTIAEWLTPNGRSINTVGIEPDIEVERTIENYNANRDPQYDKAIEIIGGKTTSTGAEVKTP